MKRHTTNILLTWATRAVHRKGFGIQSPWAYELVRDVFFETLAYYAFDTLMWQRKNLNTGNKAESAHDEQLFRIANYMHPLSVVEVSNTGFTGILYLAAPHPDTPCTLVTNDEPPALFNSFFKGKILMGEELAALQSLFCDDKKIGLLHIGETEQAEAIYDWAVGHTDNDSVIILENIRRHAGLWRKIVADQRAIITFDFYKWGMIVFDNKRTKQNYLL